MMQQQARSGTGRSGGALRLLRCALLLLGCAVATVTLLGLASPPLRAVAAAGPGGLLRLPLDRLVAAGCAMALVVCWLWLVVGVVSAVLAVAAAEAHRIAGAPSTPAGRLPDGLGPRWVRLLALIAVGVAVGAGPAAAEPSGERAAPTPAAVTGLPVPDRTVTPGAGRQHSSAPAHSPDTSVPQALRPVRVRRGDSLWRIASRLAPSDASPADLDRAWRRLAVANRDVVGPDPDLIFPGTALAVPEHLFGKDTP